MSRRSQSFLFALTSLLAFILLNALFFSYFYAVGQTDWLLTLFTARLMYIPVYVYLIAGSLLIGVVVTLIFYLLVQQQFRQIETKLTLLNSGQYEAPVFKTPQLPVVTFDLTASVEKLRQKMVRLQQEIQSYSDQPQLVDGKTREEILTQERHRLARELHDSVSQQLFAAMMMLSALNEVAGKPDKAAQLNRQLKLVEKIINEAQSEMRALLLHLRPISLEGKSLKQGIIQLLKELKTKIQLAMRWDISDVSLSSGVEDNLFRIVQELLSNTLRHSKAKTLEVYLKQVEQTVVLKVVDDGVGFDLKKSRHAGSYGLSNIRERAASIGGTVKIISFPQQGTSVEIRVPLVQTEKTAR
ncbi:sensor histidine kinase [Loigolactobacillus rennini]|uniref:Sensor histidine kinase n=1 Tax=Loigolactobacillus rennini DSM 20253 TaxID=1423796 RepID=A0A0R2D735_9LACO|nr:sensor histidine kinase [Loigolactobacillus rennini]KRM97764.1 two-component system, sensor histidine kinase [Loigolactobacillus rennini DSM 20253]